MCSVFALCSHHWVVLVDVLVASGNTGQKAVLSFFVWLTVVKLKTLSVGSVYKG